MTKKPAHRPSNYRPEYARFAYHHALLGATDADIACICGVSERTINTWKKKHPDFLHALKNGKMVADAKVAECLYNCAVGFSVKAVKLFNIKGKIVQHEYILHYPPDVTAQIFWLKNRRPQQFRDKPEVAVTVNKGELVDLSQPPEQWGAKELEAYLRQQGYNPITTTTPLKKDATDSAQMSKLARLRAPNLPGWQDGN